MSILISCLLFSIILPFISKIPVAYAMHQLNGYDNQYPREQQDRLTGFGARALAAHKNSFESLIIFSAAIAVALSTSNIGPLIQNLAIVHVVARIAYHLFYLVNWDKSRSLVWLTGLVCSISIIWLCLP